MSMQVLAEGPAAAKPTARQPPNRRHPFRARRHSRLPLVCRSWNELCHRPELLAELSVEL